MKFCITGTSSPNRAFPLKLNADHGQDGLN